MPHGEPFLVGDGARGVQLARRWVVDACKGIGRADLADSAELAISELVTNAVLHGEPPVYVQLRGTNEHPRVEVRDRSTTAPQPSSPAGGVDIDAFDLDAFSSGEIGNLDLSGLTSFGRGLDIVARASNAWGADIDDDGKTVWFEPAAELADDRGAPYQQTHVHPPPIDQPTKVGEVAIQVNGLPVDEFGRFQRHFRDLRREIRLLALAHEADYPLARSFSEHFEALERPLRANMGRELVDRARDAGRTTVDLRLRMPPQVARQIAGLIDLLDAADDFSRAERMLTPPRTPEQRAFQIWFLGEFRRQSSGAPPVSWSNGST